MTAAVDTAPGARLQAWRQSEGFSLEDVSGLSGISTSMLSLVERGKRTLSPRTKVQLARRVGVPVRDLFDVEPIDDAS